MRARLLFFGAIFLTGVLAACGGGGGGGGGPVPRTSSPSPTASASTAPPTPGASTITLGQPTSEPFSQVLTGSVQIPAGSGTATFTVSSTADSNTTTLDAAHLKSKSASRVRSADSGPFNGVIYLTVTTTGTVTLDGYPGFTVTSASQYYLAQYENGYWYSITGPSTVSGSTSVLAPTGSPVITVTSATPLYLALYTGGVLPSPNPFGCDGVQADNVARAHTSAVGVQPINDGATFSYSGSLNEALDETQPCVIPTATSAATVSVTVSASPDSNGTSTDEDSTETDNFATSSTQTTTKAVVSAVSGTTSTLNESSETSTDLSGDQTVTTYNAPGLVYTVTSPLPYTGSAITNAPPKTVVTSLVDGTTDSRTYSGTSGAYSENDSIAGLSQPNTIAVNSDGSATYDINSANFAFQGVSTIDLSFSAPSGGIITWTGNFGGQTQSLSIPQWWSGSLYSDTVTGGSQVTSLPSGCTNSQGIADFEPITRTISTVDPALGTTETRTITSYIAKNYPSSGDFAGPVCVAISDTQNLYYDYFLNTPAFFYFSINNQPLQTDTISEQYSWNAAPTDATRVRASSLRSAAMASLQASIDAHNAGIQFARTLERARRIEAIDQTIATKGLGGVK